MFAYCGNNPVMYIDPMGHSIIGALALGVLALGALLLTSCSPAENESDEVVLPDDDKPALSTQEAKKQIDAILSPYQKEGVVPVITFGGNSVTIWNSYLVTSKEDRLRICDILTQTGMTERAKESLSAEWKLHNDFYGWPFVSASAEHAQLEYGEDPRWYVRALSNLYDWFGFY